jgi:site-specific recombinase
MAYFSRVLARNVAGFGGNVSLGVLLAATPIAGKFFGLPLDVRHVTLSAGALALAASRLGTQASYGAWLMAVFGIVVIGALNFGVSFVLALSVALGSILLGQKQVAALIAGLEAAFDAHATQSTAPSDSAAGLSAAAKNRATDAVGR